MFKFKRMAITAKNEVTYGTDVTPAAATDAVLARNVTIKPLEQAYDQRAAAVPYLGNQGQLVAGSWIDMTFEVEVAGGGAAGTAPKYGPLLKACGLSETISAGVSVTYAPISTGEVSASIYWYMDGRLHKLLGTIGTVDLDMQAGKAPLWKFHFLGLYTIPSDAAMIAPTLTGYQKPLTVTKANTPTLTLHTFAGKVKSLQIQLGNVVNYRNLPNSERIAFTDRMTKGSIQMEDELVATKDWWTIIKNGTTGALAVTHGTVAGNIVSVAAANVQLTQPQISDDNGVAMLAANLDFVPSTAGNDEISFVVT